MIYSTSTKYAVMALMKLARSSDGVDGDTALLPGEAGSNPTKTAVADLAAEMCEEVSGGPGRWSGG
ncbi:hypothetical protein DRP77_07665 [Candidatus Poribacteria bacterium]|nr:MAG: hypothetical protein DRP77_07665 [Candidatus Poribacteria bacterium]